MNGQHKDCDVCLTQEIKIEKKKELSENIKFLEDLSNFLKNSFDDIKKLFQQIKDNKEQLKLKIKKIFDDIKNVVEQKENELLNEAENQFDQIFCNEETFKDVENLQNDANSLLKRMQDIQKNWNNFDISILIKEYVDTDNNIHKINLVNEAVKKCNINSKMKIKILPEDENAFNQFLEMIKSFGKIYSYDYKYKIKKCPDNILLGRRYKISGENNNILTKTGTDGTWMGTICEYKLENDVEYKWKVKILRTKGRYILVGVATDDFDINSSSYINCGWYIYCFNSKLCSGPPYNYYNKNTNLGKVDDEVIIVLNVEKKTLKFIINNEDRGESYNNIPLDKPLFPAVFLLNTNDVVEISEC